MKSVKTISGSGEREFFREHSLVNQELRVSKNI